MVKTVMKPSTPKKVKTQTPFADNVPSIEDLQGARSSISHGATPGDVDFYILNYCKRGGVYGPPFNDEPLLVIHLKHEARPSITYQMLDAMYQSLS